MPSVTSSKNAIDLALAVGVEMPKVAILSAVETVNAKVRSSLDVAALAKMAERGQILGGVVDGPLAFDNAVSPAAARPVIHGLMGTKKERKKEATTGIEPV